MTELTCKECFSVNSTVFDYNIAEEICTNCGVVNRFGYETPFIPTHQSVTYKKITQFDKIIEKFILRCGRDSYKSINAEDLFIMELLFNTVHTSFEAARHRKQLKRQNMPHDFVLGKILQQMNLFHLVKFTKRTKSPKTRIKLETEWETYRPTCFD